MLNNINPVTRLDFSNCEEDEEDLAYTLLPPLCKNVSDHRVRMETQDSNNNNRVSHIPLKMKRPSLARRANHKVRALQLFSSPRSPKTMMKSVSNAPIKRIPRRLICKPNTKATSPSSNFNPFTPTGRLLSKRRSTFKSEESDTSVSSIDSVLESFPGHLDLPLDLQNSSLEQIEETIAKSKRLSIHDANVHRYKEEYIEHGLLGTGTFGNVYKCMHRLDGCIYAIKRSLKPISGSYKERMAVNEVHAHSVLGKYQHVVRYYSAWAEDDHMIIQNEFCNGGSLADTLKKNIEQKRQYTSGQLKQILLHTAKGLRYIHSQNLVHMDVKPDNIFLHRSGTSERQYDSSFEDDFDNKDEDITYKLGDLGHVTCLLNPKVEEGDCRYMANEILLLDEHVNGELLTKGDIFALGLTIYEAAAGRPLPRNGDEWHALRRGQLPRVDGLAEDMWQLLGMMCSPDPQQRPSASELIGHIALVHPVSHTQTQLQQQVLEANERADYYAHHLQEAARVMTQYSPEVADSLRALLGPYPVTPTSPLPSVALESFTPPREASPHKSTPLSHSASTFHEQFRRTLNGGVRKNISPILTRRQLSSRRKLTNLQLAATL